MSDSVEDISLLGPAVLGNVSGVSSSSKEGILDATLLCSLQNWLLCLGRQSSCLTTYFLGPNP